MIDEAVDRKRALQARIRAERKVALVVNTRSRSGRRLYREARRLLEERGLAIEAAFPVRDPVRLPEIVRSLVRDGHALIVVGGGDGTVSSVVDDFAHRDVVLGLLPVGTANSFARTVGLPLDLEAAVEVVATGKVVDVDLGMVNDNYFANAAAIGLPASLARHMPGVVKRWLGRIGYLVVAGWRLLRHRPFHCTLTIGERSLSFDALEVRVANGKHQGGVLVAGEAHLESRDLVVQSIMGRSRGSILRFWAGALLGLRPAAEEVASVRAEEVVVETDPPQYVSIDGEPVARTPIRARVARQALHMMVPRDAHDLV